MIRQHESGCEDDPTIPHWVWCREHALIHALLHCACQQWGEGDDRAGHREYMKVSILHVMQLLNHLSLLPLDPC